MTRSWVWAGARAAGTSHLAHGLPCQDSFACRDASLRDGTPVLVAALADGAGSAPCADLGSLMAVTCFTDAVCSALAEGAPIDPRGDLVFYGFEEAILSLTSCAETEGRPEKHQVFGQTVTVKIKYADFRHVTRSRTLQAPVMTREHLQEISIGLTQSVYPVTTGIRLVGVSISKLGTMATSPQLELGF